MPSTDELRAAVPHIAHDMMLFRQAWEHRRLRVGWTAWYIMARNVAIFLEVPRSGGDKSDIRASDYYRPGNEGDRRRWRAARSARLAGAPQSLGRLKADASQAAAHLSWNRVRRPEVQHPTREVTDVLRMLWGYFVEGAPAPYKDLFLQAWRELHPGRR